MTIKLSAGLRNYLLDGGGIDEAFGDNGRIAIYGHLSGGTASVVPSSADDAIDANTLVLAVIGDSTGGNTADLLATLSFDAPAAGVMAKETGKTWSGKVFPGTNGVTQYVATFWRIIESTDGNATNASPTTAGAAVCSDESKKRIQGTIGPAGYDARLASTTLTSGDVKTIDYFAIAVPSA